MHHLGTRQLETPRLLLRRIRESDAEELYCGFINQEEFLYYANRQRVSLEQEKQSLAGIDEKYESNEYYNWVIVSKEADSIVGAINLRVDNYNDSVEFNYAIDNRYTNLGYMTEALNAVRHYCFEALDVHRFQGGCCVENIASRRVMEKCGLQFEGTLADYVKLRDGYHNMHMFSLINRT